MAGSLNKECFSDISVLTTNILPLDPSATLLTIKDAEENAFISTHLKENYCITERVWLGMDSKGEE